MLALRQAWEEAIARDRPTDALTVLVELEELEPEEPRWAHRRGDVLRRLGRTTEAEAAFVQAVRAYVARGFLTRAAGLARTLAASNPARADLLAELDPEPTRELRRASHAPSPLSPRLPPPPRVPPESAPMARSDPPAPPPSAAPTLASDATNEADERPTLVAGVRAERLSVVGSAMGLEPADDAGDDEVRFSDVPDGLAVPVDVTELEPTTTPEASDTIPAPDGATASQLAVMSGTAMFAELPKAAMQELVRAGAVVEMGHAMCVYRHDEPADCLYVLVEGKVRAYRARSRHVLELSEGQVFGEEVLLEGAVRVSDVRVDGRMVAIRMPKEALDRVVSGHDAVGDILFDLLVRRLVTDALLGCEPFSGFDAPMRREIGRMFEIRRVTPGLVLKQRGKRSDGFYVALAGAFEMEGEDGARNALPLGTMFGQSSLLSDAPETYTVVARKESIVLRLPAARFLAFAARFPLALAQVAELAGQPGAL